MTTCAAPTDSFVRKEFLERVGISASTLSRWVAEGVVAPRHQSRDGHRIQVFSRQDMLRARAIITIIRQYRGRLRLVDVVLVVDGAAELPEDWHHPGDSLMPSTSDEHTRRLNLELAQLALRAAQVTQELSDRRAACKSLTISSSITV
jgi:DNA-binding transcriptional MerR regulator